MKRARASLLSLAVLTTPGFADVAGNDGWYLIRHATQTARPLPAVIGTGAAAGATQAVFLRGEASGIRYAELRRDVSLKAWRGHRLRVTLRLRSEGQARAVATVTLNRASRNGIVGEAQANLPGGAWQIHQFVMDVPGDADSLAISAAFFHGEGTLWVDDLRLAAVGEEVPVTVRKHFPTDALDNNEPH